VKLLVDANLSPRLVPLLTQAGHDVAHVFDLGMGQADDEAILARALVEERAVLTADTDFVTMLALTGAELPSVVLVRRDTGRRIPALVSLLAANVAPLDGEIRKGCILVVEADRVRVRALPSSHAPREKPAENREQGVTGQYRPTLRNPRDLRFRAQAQVYESA
jgi:predicted nuclease of predicted toxin-antitoxin system